MTTYLLDANVVIALTVKEHEHHERVSAWAATVNRFAVCPIVVGALIRYLVRLGESAAIERMLELSGGFGGLLFIAQEWATTEQRHHSFELFARYVAPHFRGQLEPRHGTTEWVAGAKPRIYKSSLEITRKAFADSHQELPEALEKMKMAEELAKARSRV